MKDTILVLNAGSSSLKFSLYVEAAGSLTLHLHGQLDGLYTTPRLRAEGADGNEVARRDWAEGETLGHDGAMACLTHLLEAQSGDHRLLAVGHRVVHGGSQFSAPVQVTSDVLDALERLVPLAPLHQPHNLKPIRQLLASQPDLLQVACFDTAFHCSQPVVAQAFALPTHITERGVHRYGFHGLSYEYIASVLSDYSDQAAQGRTVVLHLGNGVSLCALQAGKSVATTMGFTALDGIPMGSRCGSLDPGVVLYLLDELKMDARAIEKLLYQQSGLLGVSGVSSDMRELLESSEPGAALAIDLFVYRIAREIGSLAAALGGLDALVFTAGIGEHAAVIRERVCRATVWLGLALDEAANTAQSACISRHGSRVGAYVIPTNEEWMIARHTLNVLRSGR